MNELEIKFVNASKSIFDFLEKEYDFIRQAPSEETKPNGSRYVVISYLNPRVVLRFIFSFATVMIAIGKVENGTVAKSPSVWAPETLSKAFWLDDLVEFHTQGAQTSVLGELEANLDNMEEVLSLCAQALRSHGSDVLNGNLSIIEDLAIINKNRADRFLP